MACSGTVYNTHVLHRVVRGMEQLTRQNCFGRDKTLPYKISQKLAFLHIYL